MTTSLHQRGIPRLVPNHSNDSMIGATLATSRTGVVPAQSVQHSQAMHWSSGRTSPVGPYLGCPRIRQGAGGAANLQPTLAPAPNLRMPAQLPLPTTSGPASIASPRATSPTKPNIALSGYPPQGRAPDERPRSPLQMRNRGSAEVPIFRGLAARAAHCVHSTARRGASMEPDVRFSGLTGDRGIAKYGDPTHLTRMSSTLPSAFSAQIGSDEPPGKTDMMLHMDLVRRASAAAISSTSGILVRTATSPRRRPHHPLDAGTGTSDSGSSTTPFPLPSAQIQFPRRFKSSSEPEAEPCGVPLKYSSPFTSMGEYTAVAQIFGRGKSLTMPNCAEKPQESEHVENVNQDSEDEEQEQDLPSKLNSAKLELAGDGQLQLHVRLTPSELIRWRDLQIFEPVSTGSFGEVFRAQYNGQDVSVKRCILNDGGSMTKEQLHNLEREINTYRALDHPQIVKYIGCVLEHPNLAVVTEFVPNGNVFDLLYSHRVNLPAAIRLKIAMQVAIAVCYMHSCDPIVIHRDLKTQNLVLDEEYSVKLCDFGKTQAFDENAEFPLQQDDNGGSPRYMAPECFQSGAYITEKVDIWSFGCCIVEVFGGPLPYEEIPQMAQVITLLLQHRQPPLVPPWFTPIVRPMIAGCFEFEPADRIAISEAQLVLRQMSPEDMEAHGMDMRRIS